MRPAPMSSTRQCSTTRNSSARSDLYLTSPWRCSVASLVPFTIDLTLHEGIRLAAVLDALGPDWDPVEVYAGEAEAARLLYADLDLNQQAVYNVLIAVGALPGMPERRHGSRSSS